MASKQFTVDRRLTIALAIVCPIAIALGIVSGELLWRKQKAVALPELFHTRESGSLRDFANSLHYD